jgi:hypothetical protein
VSVWRTLGLKRTTVVAEIRRAYARKLKAIDVDADPAAFIALRAAFDGALHEAEASPWRAENPAGDAESFALAAASPLLGETPLGQHFEPPASMPVEPAPPAPALEHDDGSRFVALENLLFGEPDEAPDPEALAAAVRAILDHPDMTRVDTSAGVENWLAGILYEAGPRSDPVLGLVIDHFHWQKSLGRWDNDWVFEELVKRRGAAVFVEQVARPSHALNGAWRDLTSAGEKLGAAPFLRGNQVRNLLEIIRRDYPAAEAYLWPHRVALWDDRFYGVAMDHEGGRGGFAWGVLAFWLIVLAARLLSSFGQGGSTAPPASVAAPRSVTTPAGDLDPIINRASEGLLNLAALEARNPPLHARLIARWNRQRETPLPSYEFEEAVRSLLVQGERAALRDGSYALHAAYWRLKRDELVWLRARDAEQCERGTRDEYQSYALPLELAARRDRIRAQALGEPIANPTPPVSQRRFMIPGPAVELAMRHSGLGADTLGAAWRGGGTPAQRCAATIALIEAALALPQGQGRRLLRDMSSGL